MPRPTPNAEQTQPSHDRAAFFATAMASLFLVGWCAWCFPCDDLLDRSGTPVGGDYPMFYLGGQIAAEGRFDLLYDQPEHMRRLHQLFPGLAPQTVLPYRYPPYVAALLEPLARWPYLSSWLLFTSFSLLAWAFVVHRLSDTIPVESDRRLARLLLVCWPVILETLVGGQASLFACAILVAAEGCVRREQWFRGGLILSLAAYKPNVLLFVGLGMVLRFPRLLSGIALGGLGLLAVAVLAGGVEPLQAYVGLASNLSLHSWDIETPYWKQHGFASWLAVGPLAALFGGQERTVLLATGGLLTCAVVARWCCDARSAKGSSDSWSMACLVVVNALFNPYAPIYDLSLLAVAAVWWGHAVWWRPVPETIASRPSPASPLRFELLCLSLFVGPHLSQSCSKIVGAQLFTIWLLAVLVWQVAARTPLFRHPPIALPAPAGPK